MFNLFSAALVISTLAGSLFDLSVSVKIFVAYTAIFEGWIILMSRLEARKEIEPFSPPCYFNPDEIYVIRQYPLFFKFPYASRDFSAALSFIQLSTFLWVPWLLYQGAWLGAVAISLNFFIAAPLSMKLNPQLFLSRATGVDSISAQGQLNIVESIVDKVTSRQAE